MSKSVMKNPRGRKPDPARDAEILEAALSVLIETGYKGMTIDLVAARAKAGKGTMYRRWSSKEKLVADAVEHLKQKQVDLRNLPDTGSLRSDLLALFKPESLAAAHQKLKILAALASVTLASDDSNSLADNALVQPWVEVNAVLIRRAIARGEVSASTDISLISQVIPSMAAYRSLVLRQPFNKKFLISIVDGVLIPAVGLKQIQRSKTKRPKSA